MAHEKSWDAIASTLLTSNGTVNGQITLASTAGLKVKQNIFLTSATQPTLELEVKRVWSGTLLEVGPINAPLSARSNVSAYTTVDGAAITANFQPRSNIPLQSINRAVYEEDPTVAIRVVQVDQFGNILGGSGGVASDVNIRDGFGNAITSTTVGIDQALDVNIVNSSPVNVDLDAFGDDDSVRVVGVDSASTQRQILVDTAGRLIPSPNVGTESDVFSDPTGDGLINLTVGPDVLVSYSHTSDIYYVTGWRYVADDYCQFTLEVRDGVSLVEIIDISTNNSQAGGHFQFATPIRINGAATRTIRVVAQRLNNGGTPGHAAAGINGFVI